MEYAQKAWAWGKNVRSSSILQTANLPGNSSLPQKYDRPECPSYLVAQPCDRTLPSVPKRTRYVKDAGRPGRARGNRRSEISTTATSPSLWKRVTGNRENHSTFCTSGRRLATSIYEFGAASG